MKEIQTDKLDDNTILEGIRCGKSEVLQYVYQNFYKKIEALVVSQYGSENEAKDIFHEGIYIVYKNISRNGFVLKKNFESYFFMICRNKWLHARKKKKEIIYMDFSDEDENILLIDEFETLEEEYINDLKLKVIYSNIKKLNKNCRMIFQLFLNKNKAADVATKMNLNTENHARKKKFDCMKELKKLLEADPLFKNLKDE